MRNNELICALEQALLARFRDEGHADPAAHLAGLSPEAVRALVGEILAG